MKPGSFDIVALKRTALSSPSEALDAIPRTTAIVIRHPNYFSYLAEIILFWLRRAASPTVLLLSLDPTELKVEAACLQGLKHYMYVSREGGVSVRRRVSHLWPAIVNYAVRFFSEFSSNLYDLTLPEYIPAILEPLGVIIADMTNPVVDLKEEFYKTLMSGPVLNSMLKSWIKIFSRVESYGGAHCSMNRCLATLLHTDKKEGLSDQYPSLLESIPDDVALSCAHRVKYILRAAPRKDLKTVEATLQFLVITASAPASFRMVLFHHGIMTTVLKFLCSLARRPPPSVDDIPRVCAVYLNLALSESDRKFPFNRAILKSLLIPPNSVTYGLSMCMFKVFTTLSMKCIDPHIFRRIDKVLKRTCIDPNLIPEGARHAYILLLLRMDTMATVLSHLDVRQLRLCSSSQCQRSSCSYSCSNCPNHFYCSRMCQKEDWLSHRSKCRDNSNCYQLGTSIAFSKGSYRLAAIEQLVRYEVFSSHRKADIAEARMEFLRRHPDLELREVRLAIDFTEEDWPIRVGHLNDKPLPEDPKDGLWVSWKVPFPSMTVTTSGSCFFDSEQEMCSYE